MAKPHKWIGNTCIKCGLIRTPKKGVVLMPIALTIPGVRSDYKTASYYEYNDGFTVSIKRPDCKTLKKRSMSTKISQILETVYLPERKCEAKILNDDVIIFIENSFRSHQEVAEIIELQYKEARDMFPENSLHFEELGTKQFLLYTEIFKDVITYAINKFPDFKPPKYGANPFQY